MVTRTLQSRSQWIVRGGLTLVLIFIAGISACTTKHVEKIFDTLAGGVYISALKEDVTKFITSHYIVLPPHQPGVPKVEFLAAYSTIEGKDVRGMTDSADRL